MGPAVSVQVPRDWTYSGIKIKTFKFHLQDCHPLWSAFPCRSVILLVFVFLTLLPQKRNSSGLGCFPFARRYWGNRFFFLFQQVLRCFSSLRWPRVTYVFSYGLFGYPGVNICLPTRPGLSQTSTPFIAFWCQDILHAPLVTWSHELIALLV